MSSSRTTRSATASGSGAVGIGTASASQDTLMRGPDDNNPEPTPDVVVETIEQEHARLKAIVEKRKMEEDLVRMRAMVAE
jgi:hypothetical protein